MLSASASSLLLGGCGESGYAPPEPPGPEPSNDGLGLVQEGPEPRAVGEPLPPPDEHGLLGISPNRGPFSGGQRAVLRGRGFSSSSRAWVGSSEVEPGLVQALGSERLQITVPPGAAGQAAVWVQSGDDPSTRRGLLDAYTYDPFSFAPAGALVSGGETLTLTAPAGTFSEDASVEVGGAACDDPSLGPLPGGLQQLSCVLPPGQLGNQRIVVTSSDRTLRVDSGFEYVPGAAPRGGLSGDSLAGQLEVIVTSRGGGPLAEATVIVGGGFDPADRDAPGSNVQSTDARGRVVFDLQELAEPPSSELMVTVAARCMQPLTFYGVEVDTVRAELLPVASPACGQGSLPRGGGAAARPVVIRGQLRWAGGIELRRAVWTNVPTPAFEGDRRAAYLLQPSGSPDAVFRLPREVTAITVDAPGRQGYEFEYTTGSGSRTLYAIAGVENRQSSPPRFTGYALGVAPALFAQPGETIEDLIISMDHTLDQRIELTVQPPDVSDRGPDAISATVAVQLPRGGYVPLPGAEANWGVTQGGSAFVDGLPPLDGILTGGRYVSRAAATSRLSPGPQGVLPLAVARDTVQPLGLGRFVALPTVAAGSEDGLRWNHTLGVNLSREPEEATLLHISVSSGAGLIRWQIAGPPREGELQLPDLTQLAEGGLVEGPVTITASVAAIDGLDLRTLRTGHLSFGSWRAYSSDTVEARL